MKRWRVDSSMLITIGYDSERKQLELECHDGRLIVCQDVEPEVTRQMLDAGSKGRFYHNWIRGFYQESVIRGVGGRDWA